MADLTVIYDPESEIAAIVNVDDRCGWGPAMIGPNAQEVLQAFIDSHPYDVTIYPASYVQQAFQSFLDTIGGGGQSAPAQGDPVAAESPGGTGVDGGAPLAQAEAANATDTPGPQPADTDMEADQGEAPQVMKCPLCTMDGGEPTGLAEDGTQCPMCHGRKFVAAVQ